MKILYLHGFGSKFDKSSDKIKSLEKIGDVVGIDIDYTLPKDSIISKITNFVNDNKIELIVGTSMGGYMAGHVGTKELVPHVMINPAIDPSVSLLKYIGDGYNYSGKHYNLSENTIKQYEPLDTPREMGLLILDKGDEVIDYKETLDKIGKSDSIVFDGGSHRFDHMEESLDKILSFVATYSYVSGFSELI